MDNINNILWTISTIFRKQYQQYCVNNINNILLTILTILKILFRKQGKVPPCPAVDKSIILSSVTWFLVTLLQLTHLQPMLQIFPEQSKLILNWVFGRIPSSDPEIGKILIFSRWKTNRKDLQEILVLEFLGVSEFHFHSEIFLRRTL